MGREEQVRDAKCTRPSLSVEGLAPRLVIQMIYAIASESTDWCVFYAPGDPTRW